MDSRLLLSPPLAADLFVGFLYATAAQAVSFGYLTHSDNRNFTGALLTILCLFFLGSDWVSRYRVRIQFEDETRFSQWVNALKFSLEIMTLFCLAIALEGYIRDQEPNRIFRGFFRSPGTAFALFALLSGVWNILLLWKLNLPLRRLLKASLDGTLDTLKEVRPYVTGIYDRQACLASRAQEALSPESASAGPIHTLKLAKDLMKQHLAIAAQRSLIVTTGELIVIHITLGNLVAGTAILLSEKVFGGEAIIPMISISALGWEFSPVRIILLFLVLLIFFFFSYGVAGRGSNSDFLGCLLSWILVVGLYASFSSTILVIVLAAQQVIASNILGSWMTSPQAEAPDEESSPSAEA